ncbi:MAG: HEAT repeat domain-containing protein [Myxococcota bacterium]|nr:HEAT repeat domain-containing protein [Myxococcota bacterium]
MTLLFVLACATTSSPEPQVAAEAQAVESLPSRPADAAPPQDAPSLGAEGALSAESDAVRALLLAHDVQDLPTREALDTHPDAAQKLADLAVKDPQLVVRERALLLLALYPESHIGVFCRKMLEDNEPKVRAAAARCLAGQDVAASESMREALEDALADEDPRVGIAAAEVLADVPASRKRLEEAAASEKVHPQTQTRIHELLES